MGNRLIIFPSIVGVGGGGASFWNDAGGNAIVNTIQAEIDANT